MIPVTMYYLISTL